jgi:type IV pilus assembly protein PilC
MGEFVCKVADARGRVFTQVENASTATEVRQRLGEKGLYVYSVRGQSLASFFEREGDTGLKRISGNDFLLFNQQLATLIRAGLPIIKALDLLAQRTNKPALAAVMDMARKRVRSGASLSDALRETGMFSGVYTTAVLAGERSGDLVGVLEQYIAYQKVTGSVRRKLITALVYPALLVLVSIIVLTSVIIFIIPQFAALYDDMNAELPALTQAVIVFSNQIREWVLLLLVIAVGGVAALFATGRNRAGARALDRIWMDLPLVGTIVRQFRLSQFARTLGTLLKGGIPLVSALETAGGAMESPVLRHAVALSAEKVREGRALNAALSDTGVVPEMVTEMIEVGEATGALPAMLESVAEFYDEELDARVATLMSLVEPLLLLAVGGTVLVILIALYLPIFSIGAVIQ